MSFKRILTKLESERRCTAFAAPSGTGAAEETNFPREVCEQALAHKISNAVEAAYRRGDLLEKHRQLMQAWSDYVHSA
jgi:hypothetical protein